MENQHRHIKGYRELDKDSIDLMNKVKVHGQVLDELIKEVKQHIAKQRSDAGTLSTDERDAEIARLNAAEPERFAAMAKTEFQTGLMYLTRAVAQPTFF